MALAFSDAARSQIDALLKRYPTKMAACLPVLWIAQREFGHISPEVAELVAATLDLPPAHVHGVATFYTMYHKEPPPRFHVQVCTNVSCMLRGAYEVLARFEQVLGCKVGERTADGRFGLDEVECLAACGTAPCVQINERYYEPVLPDDVARLVASLQGEAQDRASGGGEA